MDFYFDEESFNQLEKWWNEHGNPDIVILPRWDNQIMFYNKVKRRETATITKWDGNSCNFNYGQPLLSCPFNESEKERIYQFMKINNELPTIICENCGRCLVPGDSYYKWEKYNFCSKKCVAEYITEQTDLPRYVFEQFKNC